VDERWERKVMLASRISGRVLLALATALALTLGLLWIGQGTALGKPACGNNSAAAKQCAAWQGLYKEDGGAFANRGDCTSYAARGGSILTEPPVTLNIWEQACLEEGGTPEDPIISFGSEFHRCAGLPMTSSGSLTANGWYQHLYQVCEEFGGTGFLLVVESSGLTVAATCEILEF
jgi:hypothetical protein